MKSFYIISVVCFQPFLCIKNNNERLLFSCFPTSIYSITFFRLACFLGNKKNKKGHPCLRFRSWVSRELSRFFFLIYFLSVQSLISFYQHIWLVRVVTSYDPLSKWSRVRSCIWRKPDLERSTLQYCPMYLEISFRSCT